MGIPGASCLKPLVFMKTISMKPRKNLIRLEKNPRFEYLSKKVERDSIEAIKNSLKIAALADHDSRLSLFLKTIVLVWFHGCRKTNFKEF